MRLAVSRDALMAACARVRGAVAARSTIPILTSFLIEANGERLRIAGTDLDMEASDTLPAQVDTEGVITLEAKRLTDILRALPTGSEIALSAEDSRATLKCGRSQFKLGTLPAGDFPVRKIPEDAVRGSIGAAELRRLLETVAHAVSTEQTRAYLCVAYLHTVVIDGELWLRAVATDGGALAYAQTLAPEALKDLPPMLIPASASRLMVSLLAGHEGEVELMGSKTAVGVEIGEARLSSALMDGDYADYARVIPKRPAHGATLNVAALTAALGIASSVDAASYRHVWFALEPGSVTLRGKSGFEAESETTLPAEYDGPAFEAILKAKNLLDAAGAMRGETLALYPGPDATEPVTILDPADDTSLFLAMPMRA